MQANETYPECQIGQHGQDGPVFVLYSSDSMILYVHLHAPGHYNVHSLVFESCVQESHAQIYANGFQLDLECMSSFYCTSEGFDRLCFLMFQCSLCMKTSQNSLAESDVEILPSG